MPMRQTMTYDEQLCSRHGTGYFALHPSPGSCTLDPTIYWTFDHQLHPLTGKEGRNTTLLALLRGEIKPLTQPMTGELADLPLPTRMNLFETMTTKDDCVDDCYCGPDPIP